MKRMVVRISEDTGRNVSRESTRRLVTRKTPCTVVALALVALSTSALATACSDYRERITAFGALISDFENNGRFDRPAYEAARVALNASQNAAIDAKRRPTASDDLDVVAAAKASIDASVVVSQKALASAQSSTDVLKDVIVAIPGVSIGDPSALANVDKVGAAVSTASSLALETVRSAAIASALAWMVFYKAIYAAVCP